MQMSPEEIKRSYQTAADPKAQIEILADLNLCGKEDIRKILIEQGIPEDTLPKKRGRKKKLEETVVVSGSGSDPVEEQKEGVVIPMRVKSALYGVLREKELQMKQVLLNKEAAEKAIMILQEDICEINEFLDRGDPDRNEED